MGILKDVIDVAKDTDLKGAIKNARGPRSISKLAQDGIMHFPCIVSRSMDIDTLQIITKALERQYSTFVQVAIGMNNNMDISTTKNASDFLKTFHQNTHRIFEGMYELFENDNFVMIGATYEGATTSMIAQNKEQMIDLLEHVRKDTLNNKYVPKAEVIYNFKNPELNAKYNTPHKAVLEKFDEDQWNRDLRGGRSVTNVNYDPITGARTSASQTLDPADTSMAQARVSASNNADKIAADDARSERQLAQQQQFHQDKMEFDEVKHIDSQINKRIDQSIQIEKNRTDRQAKNAQIRNDRQKLQLDRDKFKYQQDKDRYDRDSQILMKDVLVDNDVKKANELIATTLHIRVRQINKRDENVGIMDFLIGIKAMMHPVRGTEMVSNLVAVCTDDRKAFNFLRWTTGEINFFSDFLFNIKGMKNDVANRSAGASQWWIALKRRKSMAKIKNAFPFKNKLLPNATLVVSAEEVERIKSLHGYDLMDRYFLNKVMSGFFLLGFVVVDSSAQMAHFMFDGRDDFETVSFSGLEKENTANERKFKEMLKAINRN